MVIIYVNCAFFLSDKASVIVPLVLIPALVTAVIIGFVCRGHLKAADSPGNLPDGLRAGQPYSPTEERSDGETRSPSCSNLILPRQLVRTKSFAGTEDERKVLCESLNSSASNSQHSLTGLPSSAFPAPPPRASLVVSMQPDRRVRAAAHLHPCFHPCFLPSHLLTPCLLP